jgi:hypothetical protein
METLVGARCERMRECAVAAGSSFDKQACSRSSIAALLCDAGFVRPAKADLRECEIAQRHLDCGLIHKTWWPPACEAIERDLGIATFEGELCGGAAFCAKGLRCEYAGNDCAGTCVPAHAKGDACSASGHCPGTSICSSARVCEQPRRAGVACASDFDCEGDCVGQVCMRAVDLLDQACQEADGSCGSALRCLSGSCAPLAELGEPCSAADDCLAGSSCIEGRCVLASACGSGRQGDACAANGQCAPGLVCHGGQRRCVPAPAVGAACSLEMSCAAGLACVGIRQGEDGACERHEVQPNGADCSWFWECQSGFCADGRCTEFAACQSP